MRLTWAAFILPQAILLIAKQIIAGEKIIGIRFFNLRYSNNFHLNTFFQISSNASAKTINGAKTIANQITQILIIKTIATTISGIQIAKTYQRDIATFNKDAKVHASDDIIHFHEFSKDEYKAVNTPT